VLSVWKPDASGTPAWYEDILWRGSAMAGSFRGSQLRYYALDHLGSPRFIRTATGTNLGTQSFEPFGTGGTADGGPLQFTGHERDGALFGDGSANLPDYFHARYYQMGVGRFLSVDPIVPSAAVRQPQRWNRYAYAANNPLLRVDPDGRKDTIYIVNTTHGNGFTASQLAALNRAVAGTRFEGNVRVVGPMANNAAMLRTIRGANSTDMVGLISHSGRSSFHSNGNIFTQKKMDAAAVSGVLQGGLQGNDLAAAVNPSNPVGACMLAGCSSDQAASSMMTNANVLTFGTTNHVNLTEVGNALVATLGALAQGATPEDAARAGSTSLTLKPDCAPSNDCDPNHAAGVVAAAPPK
jgi:RHS repeat-associated protein